MATKRREEKRLERLYKDRQIIADLRKHFEGYGTKEGFSLSPEKIAKIPYSQKRGMRAKHKKLQTLLKHPFVDFVKPADDASRKALKRFTGERMRGMKHFVVAKPSAESTVRVVGGDVQLKTKFPGEAAFTERFFMFPNLPRSHKHMLAMFDKMYSRMPPGMYVLQSKSYGDIGEAADRGQIREKIEDWLMVYDKPKYGDNRFMYELTGVRWISSTLKGAVVQTKARDEARNAQRKVNQRKREKLKDEVRANKKKAKRKKR